MYVIIVKIYLDGHICVFFKNLRGRSYYYYMSIVTVYIYLNGHIIIECLLLL